MKAQKQKQKDVILVETLRRWQTEFKDILEHARKEGTCEDSEYVVRKKMLDEYDELIEGLEHEG